MGDFILNAIFMFFVSTVVFYIGHLIVSFISWEIVSYDWVLFRLIIALGFVVSLMVTLTEILSDDPNY